MLLAKLPVAATHALKPGGNTVKLNFLCTHHQNWLLLNPAAALTTCLQSYDAGMDFAEDGNYSMAVNHAGCALEAAIILMRVDGGCVENKLVFLCSAGELLVRTLFELQQLSQAHHVYDGVLLYIESALLEDAQRKEALSVSSKWLDLRTELGLVPDLRSGPIVGQVARLH